MPFTRCALSLIVLMAFLAGPARDAAATSIDPFTWEELVLDADFVGIIECTTAGGMVARYEVVESFKGPAEGEELSLRIALNYWGGQFPVALVGERFLVTAFKEAPSSMVSTSFGGPVPLWWRQIPADYSTPLLQGRVRLPLRNYGGDGPLQSIGSAHPSLEDFRRAARELLELPPEDKEERLLRGQAEKYLFGGGWAQGLPKESPVRERLAEAEGAEAIITILLEVAREQQPDGPSYPVYTAMRRAGRETTLRIIEEIPIEASPLGEEYHQELVRKLRRRLGKPVEEDTHRDWEWPPPTKEELREFRRLLKEKAPYREAGDAIMVLTESDPDLVRPYLLDWENPAEDWRDADAGYFLGSYFAWRVKDDRSRHLRSLGKARDPYVRVAAAVYLCFDNEELGKKRLRELMSLDGLPGVWAALTLARRGEKSAVDRALQVFRQPGDDEGSSNHHRNFEDRVMVLLSNTAKASGLPQPGPPAPRWRFDDEEPDHAVYEYFGSWWEKHEAGATLHDPWLPILEGQKVD